MVRGPEAGLEVLGELESAGELAGHYRLDAVRAHLLEMAGRTDEAIEGYRRAAGLTQSEPERRYLETKCAPLKSCPSAKRGHRDSPAVRRSNSPNPAR
jgi:predicted RNA polymerase sigma factor